MKAVHCCISDSSLTSHKLLRSIKLTTRRSPSLWLGGRIVQRYCRNVSCTSNVYSQWRENNFTVPPAKHDSPFRPVIVTSSICAMKIDLIRRGGRDLFKWLSNAYVPGNKFFTHWQRRKTRHREIMEISKNSRFDTGFRFINIRFEIGNYLRNYNYYYSYMNISSASNDKGKLTLILIICIYVYNIRLQINVDLCLCTLYLCLFFVCLWSEHIKF